MDLKDKTVLITGSTDGIGKETAFEALSLGAKVIIHGRNQQRIDAATDEINKRTGSKNIIKFCADFNSLAAVNEMAEQIISEDLRIDILLNNAAEFKHEKVLTGDGFETQFQVNYLSPFLLTEKLLPFMKDRHETRILNVSSMIHSNTLDFENLQGEKEYSGAAAYAMTKLLNILHANDLAERLRNNKVIVHSLHPGVIETKLLNAAWSGGAPVSEGASNLIYAATSEAVEHQSGLYIENRRPMQSNPISYDSAVQKKLRDLTYQLLSNYLQ